MAQKIEDFDSDCNRRSESDVEQSLALDAYLRSAKPLLDAVELGVELLEHSLVLEADRAGLSVDNGCEMARLGDLVLEADRAEFSLDNGREMLRLDERRDAVETRGRSASLSAGRLTRC